MNDRWKIASALAVLLVWTAVLVFIPVKALAFDGPQIPGTFCQSVTVVAGDSGVWDLYEEALRQQNEMIALADDRLDEIVEVGREVDGLKVDVSLKDQRIKRLLKKIERLKR